MSVISKTPSRAKALSLFTRAREMMVQVVQHHQGEISRLKEDLDFNTSELKASQKSLDALDQILGTKEEKK